MLMLVVVAILGMLVKPTQHIPNQDVLIIAANMTMLHTMSMGVVLVYSTLCTMGVALAM